LTGVLADRPKHQLSKISMKKIKIRKIAKNISLEILDYLKDLSELLPEPFESKYEYQKRAWGSLTQHYSSKQIRNSLFDLQKRGLVIKDKKVDRVIYRLTVTGEQKLLMSKITAGRTRLNNGLSTIIIFDIPEQFHSHRTFLRRLLLKNGFTHLQKSVFIGPFELPNEFWVLMDQLKIKQYVSLIQGRVVHT
jgi:CRISPR/Cas system-associated endoribonuclease Cas2